MEVQQLSIAKHQSKLTWACKVSLSRVCIFCFEGHVVLIILINFELKDDFRILQPRSYFPLSKRQLETKRFEIGPVFTARD